MKTMKLMLLALMLCVGALFSSAAVVHDTTLYGYDFEGIVVYDPVEFTEVGRYDVNSWEVDILVYDDADGYAQITWHTTVGDVISYYEVGANASTFNQTAGGVVWDAAFMALLNYLYPF